MDGHCVDSSEFKLRKLLSVADNRANNRQLLMPSCSSCLCLKTRFFKKKKENKISEKLSVRNNLDELRFDYKLQIASPRIEKGKLFAIQLFKLRIHASILRNIAVETKTYCCITYAFDSLQVLEVKWSTCFIKKHWTSPPSANLTCVLCLIKELF